MTTAHQGIKYPLEHINWPAIAGPTPPQSPQESKDKGADGKKQQNRDFRAHAVSMQSKPPLLPKGPALFDQRLRSSANHAQSGEHERSPSKMTGIVDKVPNNQAPQRDMERIPKKGRPRKAVHVQSSDPGISLDMKKRMDKWRPRKAVPAQSSARKLALAEVREIEGAANALIKLSKEAWGYGKGDPSIKPKKIIAAAPAYTLHYTARIVLSAPWSTIVTAKRKREVTQFIKLTST
ncbi:MAG: hypothetical protein Q9221_003462 [Calogaya cf. arnoldii]